MSDTTITADIRVENHGSIMLFHLLTDTAREWVQANVEDGANFMGGALVVEPRYAEHLAGGMGMAGLEVE